MSVLDARIHENTIARFSCLQVSTDLDKAATKQCSADCFQNSDIPINIKAIHAPKNPPKQKFARVHLIEFILVKLLKESEPEFADKHSMLHNLIVQTHINAQCRSGLCRWADKRPRSKYLPRGHNLLISSAVAAVLRAALKQLEDRSVKRPHIDFFFLCILHRRAREILAELVPTLAPV